MNYFEKALLITNTGLIIVLIVANFVIVNLIKKHSVHPIYGETTTASLELKCISQVFLVNVEFVISFYMIQFIIISSRHNYAFSPSIVRIFLH